METGRLIGRYNECKRLDLCVKEEKAQLVVVYGRRRVGKTFLIDEYFKNGFAFRLTGEHGATRDRQLRNFANELTTETGSKQNVPADWKEAFFELKQYLASTSDDEKQVVFFDEMPWMDTQNSGFLGEFEYFWNSFGAKQNNLIFIVCGSSTSWMVEHIEHNKGGLFNRLTCRIYVEPFTLGETEAYLESRGISWSRYDICECYMIMGGIPYYLSLLRPDLSYAANIDNMFFRKKAELWDEFQHLFYTLFKNGDAYINIVEQISKKRSGLTRSEIADATGISTSGNLTKILRALEYSGFIKVNGIFGKKKKEALYYVSDYYTLFYLKFIKDRRGIDERFWTNSIMSPSKYAWAGYTFEMLCLDHIKQIKKGLDIGGVLSEESAWNIKGDEDHDGAQIDLLIDRQDRVINLCEMKFSTDEYVIDKEYDRILRNKAESFRRETKTKKNLIITMITTYGIKENKYSSIVGSRLTMDDLF